MGNNGHDAINIIMAFNELNQIDPSTIQSVGNQYVGGMSALPYGDLEKILYKGQTKGGRGVNIGREVPGYPLLVVDKEILLHY